MNEHADADVLECRAIAREELAAGARIAGEYVGTKRDEFRRLWEARPEWFRGAFRGGDLVGVCYGCERPGQKVVLQGIAVVDEHWRRGIGTALIRDFERVVFEDGAMQISLGSASDEPTERFYVKNGYLARRLVLLAPRGTSVSARLPAGIELVAVRDEGDGERIEIEVGSYSREMKEKIERTCFATDGMYIFEKFATAI